MKAAVKALRPVTRPRKDAARFEDLESALHCRPVEEYDLVADDSGLGSADAAIRRNPLALRCKEPAAGNRLERRVGGLSHIAKREPQPRFPGVAGVGRAGDLRV